MELYSLGETRPDTYFVRGYIRGSHQQTMSRIKGEQQAVNHT